jgi:hypothetical protein
VHTVIGTECLDLSNLCLQPWQDSGPNNFTGIPQIGNGVFTGSYYDAKTSPGNTGIQLPTAFIPAFLALSNFTIMIHFSGEVGAIMYYLGSVSA